MRIRWSFLAAAILVVLLALLSPLETLANGVLFSAHMMQHILLLLIAPALAWIGFGRPGERRGEPPDGWLMAARGPVAAVGWLGGVGSMWVWHVPALCDAAATNSGVHALQVVSLLGFGLAFWRPILGPRADGRLGPASAIVYLFTACLACTALGIILTLTPVEVCSAFRAPLANERWTQLRAMIGPERDRQIGGLLMWVPMCLVYLAAIIWELARWMGAPAIQEEKT